VLADAQRKEALTDWGPGEFEQPLTGRLQTSCHDLTDPLEELKTKRVISFGVLVTRSFR
jgi:hypothetical protein